MKLSFLEILTFVLVTGECSVPLVSTNRAKGSRKRRFGMHHMKNEGGSNKCIYWMDYHIKCTFIWPYLLLKLLTKFIELPISHDTISPIEVCSGRTDWLDR